jgi:hypothetical protein
LVTLAALVAVTLAMPSGGSVATAYGNCPDLNGSPDPSDPTHIVETYYFWTNDCPIPLRGGVGHIPGQGGDFGLQHILSRYNEGAVNHDLSPEAKAQWIKALAGSAAVPQGGPTDEYYCNSWQYTSASGSQRTMQVYVDLKPIGQYPYKGIITAFFASGNRPCKTASNPPD